MLILDSSVITSVVLFMKEEFNGLFILEKIKTKDLYKEKFTLSCFLKSLCTAEWSVNHEGNLNFILK